jgi:hypothetical protein
MAAPLASTMPPALPHRRKNSATIPTKIPRTKANLTNCPNYLPNAIGAAVAALNHAFGMALTAPADLPWPSTS